MLCNVALCSDAIYLIMARRDEFLCGIFRYEGRLF
jgi:hypothetical protein